jgi:Ca2+-binding RTX toxin-like protein
MADFTGTIERDVLEGTAESDIISGAGGNDDLSDRFDGSDLIDGGDGDDHIRLTRYYQTGGTVTLLGGAGNDRIILNAPSNGALFPTVDAGAGSDVVEIWALRKTATITLGAGRDVLLIDNNQAVYLGDETHITVTDFAAGADGDRIEWDWFLGFGQTLQPVLHRALSPGADRRGRRASDGPGRRRKSLQELHHLRQQ